MYLVTDMYGNELGELSQSISEKVSDYDYGYTKYAYVLELKETSSGSSTAKIRILFIED